MAVIEAKSYKQLLASNQNSKQREAQEGIHLTDDDILDSVAKLPVAQLMTQDCKDLWVVASLFLVLGLGF